jgi:hypothetical protein
MRNGRLRIAAIGFFRDARIAGCLADASFAGPQERELRGVIMNDLERH